MSWAALDYLMVLRPTLFIPLWSLMLAGYLRAATDGPLPPFILKPPAPLLLGIAPLSMLMGFVHILNQIADVESDAANKKLYLVAGGYVRMKFLVLEMALLMAGAWAAAWLAYRGDPLPPIILAASAALGVIYSVRPIRLKGRPFLDLLANAFGYGVLAFGMGWLAAGRGAEGMWIGSIPYFLSVGSIFVNTTLPDLKGDLASGDRTIGAVLGMRGSMILSSALLGCALASGAALRDPIALGAVLISLPAHVKMVASRSVPSILAANKWGVLSLSIAVGIFAPVYLLWLAFIILMTRLYYKHRFGIKYP